MLFKRIFKEDILKLKKVLITGICGFEGSNMALLWKNKYNLAGLDITSTARTEELKDIPIYYVDIREKEGIEKVFKSAKPDVIVHLAGQVSHLKSQEDPYYDLECNVKGILNILETVRKINPKCQVLYASSRSVYGFPKYLPIDEEHPTEPIDAYGITKRTAEHYCQLYTYHYGINTTCFRQANLFGPRQQVWTNVFQMVSWIFRCVALNEEFTFYGDGSQTRDFLYVDDVVKAYELAIENPEKVYGQIYNLGGHEYCSWNQVIKYAEEVTGNKAKVKYIPHSELRSKLENPHSWLSYSKYKKATGWMPIVSVKEGFKEMYKYFISEKKIEKYLS